MIKLKSFSELKDVSDTYDRISEEIQTYLRQFVNSPNNESTRRQIREYLINYVYDSSYKVVCDHTNNSDADRESRILNVDVHIPNPVREITINFNED